MPGDAAEGAALDVYYATTKDAIELVRQKLVDEGLEKWERALRDVAPHIPSEQLNELKRKFDKFRARIDIKPLGDDIIFDSSDDEERVNSGHGGHNDSPDIDNSATIEDYRDEYMKLAKRPTMRCPGKPPRIHTRSQTMPILKRNVLAQLPCTGFGNDSDRFHILRGGTESSAGSSEDIATREPIMSSEPRTISEPATSPDVEGEDQVARRRTQPHRVGLMGSSVNNDWFDHLESKAHDFVYGAKRGFRSARPVKVGILDSGFALTGEARKAMKPYKDRIKGQETFTNELPNPRTPGERQQALDDPVGHGTTVAYQLMKTCPSAWVYIAKVTVTESDKKKAVPDKGAVARAIRHAAKPVADGGWGVDVINMSFGWDESELPSDAATGVSGAIAFAEERGVLLFAAASNHGLTGLNDVLYPARDRRVISVDAEDGLGNPAPFALQSQRGSGGIRYCAPGLSVDSPVSADTMSGSSFACPVAAGVAALILEFARRNDVSLSRSESVQQSLSSAQGMLKVFGSMSQQTVNHPGFRMLYPWHFLRHIHQENDWEKVAIDIIDQLQTEFGKQVGRELTFTMTWKNRQGDPK